MLRVLLSRFISPFKFFNCHFKSPAFVEEGDVDEGVPDVVEVEEDDELLR
jgi:hypothetical protein